MINRSAIKYSLKKILPGAIFPIVIFVWRKVLLHVVEIIDTLRLKKFTSYCSKKIIYKNISFELFLSPVNGFIDKHIFLYGVYEPFILDIIKENLQVGSTFIDVGANIGQHSMFAASLVGKSGHVFTFEPIPSLYNQIKDSVKKNKYEGIIHLNKIALGNKNSSELLYVSKNAGGSSIVNEDDTRETIEINVSQGDAVLRKLKSPILIKIDVEGYEYEVLSGLTQTLKKYKPTIILEYSGKFYKTKGTNHGIKILQLLREFGYRIFDIEDNLKEVLEDEAFDLTISNKRDQTNIFCKIIEQ